jgi:hypothetical protein
MQHWGVAKGAKMPPLAAKLISPGNKPHCGFNHSVIAVSPYAHYPKNSPLVC